MKFLSVASFKRGGVVMVVVVVEEVGEEETFCLDKKGITAESR